jgi:8-oxo-dGTP diphosphatase
MAAGITEIYGHKMRVRVCGLCWRNSDLLMVNHRGITHTDFWAPPGGGLEYGESVAACLKKEFAEETGLRISVGRFLFGCEFLQPPLHAIELYFDVTVEGGVLVKGDDPELPMIEEVRFLSPAELGSLPANTLHGIFSLVQTPGELKTLNGFIRI